MAYRNLDLTISRGNDGYLAKLQTDGGAVDCVPFSLSIDDDELESLRKRLSPNQSNAINEAKKFGGNLYQAIFKDHLAAGFRSAYDNAKAQGDKVRLRLRMNEAPELAALPWEYLYDKAENQFLALLDALSLTRYTERPQEHKPLETELPLRVVEMFSDPSDIESFTAEEDWDAERVSFNQFSQDVIQPSRLPQASLAELQKQLSRGQQHIFHYLGHGAAAGRHLKGVLALEGKEGETDITDAEHLGRLLGAHPSLRLAVLASCEGAKANPKDLFTNTAQTLIRAGVPAVVGMQFDLSYQAGPIFIESFYQAIAGGEDVDDAMRQARLAIYADNPAGVEWGTPVLFLRSPQGNLFKLPYVNDNWSPPFNRPEHFIERPAEYEELVKLLLGKQQDNQVAIAAALRGAGGFGKTTLAKAICFDPRIRAAFPDGMLWTELGETPSSLIDQVKDWIFRLSGRRPDVTTLNAAITELVALLANRRMLLVIDDVWNRNHVEPFVQGGPRCARLITTRNLDTLPSQAQPVKVDAMQPDEAVAMLRTGLFVRSTGFSRNASDIEVLPTEGGTTNEFSKELRALASQMGEWPLLLKLANGALRENMGLGLSFSESLDFINEEWNESGILAFDAGNETDRNRAVAATLNVSFKLLDPKELACFNELAIFPEDTDIPLETINKLWATSGKLNVNAALKLFKKLHSLSLLLGLDLKSKTLRLHDVIRSYLIQKQKDNLHEVHRQLLDAHRPDNGWAALDDEDRYFWNHLAEHLVEAGCGDELVATVKDWRYLAKKTLLRKSLSVESDLIQAVKHAPEDDPLQTLRRTFANTGHLFNHCQTLKDLEPTIFIRFQHLIPVMRQMLNEMKHSLNHPYIAAHCFLPDEPHSALIRTLEGHSGEVRSCVFSPDGKLILSASNDRTLKVWDATTGELHRTLEGHSDWVRCCAFSPDGKLIVSASDDNTLKVWDLMTGELYRTLEGHLEGVYSCAFSSDGKLIVSASDDRTVKLWDSMSGELYRTIEGHSAGVSSCAFSPDGKQIISASNDHTLKAWELATGELRQTLEGHSRGVNSCAFSPDGKLIVSSSWDHTLKVWDAQTGQLLSMFEGHWGGVIGIAFSLDGQQVVSASDDGTVKVWCMKSGKLKQSLKGHSGTVNSCAFSPDGKLIVSASNDSTLKVWDAVISRISHTLEGRSEVTTCCVFGSDGRWVASSSWDSTLKVWDVTSGKLQQTLEGHSDWVRSCGFSPDGKQIVSASDDRTLKVWDAMTGELCRTIEGHSGTVDSCSFSPDGKQIISASNDRTLKVWDAMTGELCRTLKGHSAGVNSCAFSPDGKQIISASNDRTLKVWDAMTGKLCRTIEGHSGIVDDCTFSPNGKQILSASNDRTLKVWDAMTGELRRTIEGHSGGVNSCAFSLDGKHIVSASNDRTLKVWDAVTGKCIATFYADGQLYACAVCGEEIAAGGARGVYFLRLVQ